MNNKKTILLASLIVAMALSFRGMNYAEAEVNTSDKSKVSKTEVDWDKATTSDKGNTVDSAESIGVSSTSVLYRTCNHEASMDNKCYGWDNNGMSYYKTPYYYKNVDSCGGYTCADLDYYRYAYNLISESAYAYTFKSASYYACALETGLCTSPIFSTSNSGIIHHNNIPTGEPITHVTTYTYERQGSTITYYVLDQMLDGYS